METHLILPLRASWSSNFGASCAVLPGSRAKATAEVILSAYMNWPLQLPASHSAQSQPVASFLHPFVCVRHCCEIGRHVVRYVPSIDLSAARRGTHMRGNRYPQVHSMHSMHSAFRVMQKSRCLCFNLGFPTILIYQAREGPGHCWDLLDVEMPGQFAMRP